MTSASFDALTRPTELEDPVETEAPDWPNIPVSRVAPVETVELAGSLRAAGASPGRCPPAVTSASGTLPVERRRPAQPAQVLRTYATLMRDRELMALVVIGGLVFATLFAYISGSTFVLQNVYGMSTTMFAIVFGANAFGLVLATQVNPRLVRRLSPRRVLQGAVVVAAVAAVLMLVAAMPTSVGF